MPKRNPPKPKPDPLAKLSAANLRRMVKRLRTRVNQLEAMLASSRDIIQHGRGDRQGLAARLREIDNEVREVYGSLQMAHIERDRLAAELAAMKRATTMMTHSAPVETHAGPTAMWAVDAVSNEAEERQRVVVGASPGTFMSDNNWQYFAVSPQYRYAIEQGGEPTGTAITRDNTPAVVQVPPFGAGMPGATLTPQEVFNPHVAWSWLYWDWRRSPLTCPTVAQSPWLGVMRGNPFVGHNARPETDYWRIDPLLYQDDGHVRPVYWERSSGAGFLLHETYPLAHTGPVKIGGGE